MLRLRFEGLTGRRQPIELAGHALLPVAAGALYWEAEDTLLVADLHLEKGAAFAARGIMLPPYDTLPASMSSGRAAWWRLATVFTGASSQVASMPRTGTN